MGGNDRLENLVPPSSLYNAHDAEGVRSADWAVSLEAPTGVTDDRSETMESTIASLDSFEDQMPTGTALPTKTTSTALATKGALLRSPNNGPTKIFTPPHGAATPRSSNQRAKEASSYFIMDDKADQKQRHLFQSTKESDGIFRNGPQGWWESLRNRVYGPAKTSTDLPTRKVIRPTQVSTNKNGDFDPDPADVSFLTRMGVFLCSSALIYIILFVGMAAGFTYGTMNQLLFFSNINWDEQITVAFVGTSYLFVNDIPRLLEAISGGQVIQDSCLRSGGSLVRPLAGWAADGT